MVLIILLVVFGHLVTELATLNQHYGWMDVKPIQPFIAFTWPGDGIPSDWFMKFAADEILWLCYSLAFALVCLKIDRRLFVFACGWVLYHLVDGFMFFYNFKQFQWLHWCLVGIVATNGIIQALIHRSQRLKPVK